jgi:hypothetical protein
MSTDAIIDLSPSTALTVPTRGSVLLMPVMDVPTALARLKEFQSFCAEYLQESKDGGQDGGDYGVIPGTKKKTLLKSGAEKLCEIYGLADEYVMLREVENWDTGLFAYTLKCVLKSRRDDSVVGEGLGSCSSFESKYRWREQQKTCPQCGAAAIIKGKEQYGGGWLCWNKKGGCGAKFPDGDKGIERQPVGRIENPDIIDTKNTIIKMAKKRAKIDAVIGVTRSSGIFAQDLDEIQPTPTRPVVAEEPAKPAKQPQNSTAPSAQTPAPSNGDTITEAQKKLLFATSRRAGWKDAELKQWLLDLWNYESTTAITRKHFDAILEQLKIGRTADSDMRLDGQDV